MQRQFSKVDKIPNSESLVISASREKMLTKNQLAFNKLTQKIEKLQKDIGKKEIQFDAALKIYGSQIHPIINRLGEYRRLLVTILWETYKSNQLARADQRHLTSILKEHVRELCLQMEDDADEALKQMYRELEGETIDAMRQRENDLMRNDLEDMLEGLNVDIDFEGVDMNDKKVMQEKIAELQRKLFDMEEAAQEDSVKTKKVKKKTAKQQESERIRKAAEEMQQKNISTIYKQLAKLFHPDLEQDEERKIEKGILMRELTNAYEAKNLHALLRLELKWIHKENDHLESLTDEKLSVYLQILRQQANDLEGEFYQLVHQPKYSVLMQTFGFSITRSPLATVKEHLTEIQNVEGAFKRDLEDFKSPDGLRHIKGMINEWKEIARERKRADMDLPF